MVAYLLYNRNTPGERLMQDMKKRLDDVRVDNELLDADSPRGIDFVEHYDIMGRPAVALIKEEGTPIQVWEGEDRLPPPAEVAGLAHQ